MPNPGLSEAEIAQTIGAVERVLREGYPPPRQARRGARSAIMRATELLTEIERRPTQKRWQQRARLLEQRLHRRFSRQCSHIVKVKNLLNHCRTSWFKRRAD